MQTKPAHSRFAHFLIRSTCGIALAASLLTAGLAVYCFANVQSFFAGAKPLDATIINLQVQPGEDRNHSNRLRFDAQLNQPVDGKQSVTMTGLYRVAAVDEGRSITLFYNPNHAIKWAMSSPWNYVGSGIYAAIALLLLAVSGALHLLFRYRKTTPFAC